MKFFGAMVCVAVALYTTTWFREGDILMPIIGIPLATMTTPTKESYYLSTEYIQAIEKIGAFVVLLPHTTDQDKIVRQVSHCDGFLMPGGDDVTPHLYGEEPLIKLGQCDEKVDEYHLRITKEIVEQDKPFLGICRGAQVLNIALGGSVYQDVSYHSENVLLHRQSGKRHDLCHKVYFQKGSKLYKLFGENMLVNSFHHQSISTLSPKLMISAVASDGIVEAVESLTSKFCIGVQWHPEIMVYNHSIMNKLFEALIDSCLDH